MPTGMTVDRIIAACLRGRDYVELERDCRHLVAAANLRELAKPPGVGRGCRKWANFLDPTTAIGLCYGLDIRMDVLLAAQARSIAEWYSKVKPDDAPPGLEMLNIPADPAPLSEWMPYRPSDISTIFSKMSDLIRTADVHALMPKG